MLRTLIGIAFFHGAQATTSSFDNEQLIISSASGVRSVYATDMNGDSFVDVLVASAGDNKLRLFLNDGSANSPSFSEQLISSSVVDAVSVFATDINGDSFADIMVASYGDSKVRLFLNDGNLNPSFTEQLITSSAANTWSVYATDMNRDSFVDILCASNNGEVRLFLNDGNTNSPIFTEQLITSSASGAHSVYATDMNGDSFVDILVASMYDNSVRLFVNDGNVNTPSFSEQLITSSAAGALSVYATDMNGDSFVDILVASKVDNKVRLFLNDGNVNSLSFTEQLIFGGANGAWSVYATDVNGDSFVDVVVASLDDDSVRLFANDGSMNSPSFTEQLITSSSNGPISVYATDVNGDSFVDILYASHYDGRVGLFMSISTPGPTSFPTSDPTPGPTSVPTSDPTSGPTPQPSPAPKQSGTPAQEVGNGNDGSDDDSNSNVTYASLPEFLFWLFVALLLLLFLGVGLIFYVKAKSGHKEGHNGGAEEGALSTVTDLPPATLDHRTTEELPRSFSSMSAFAGGGSDGNDVRSASLDRQPTSDDRMLLDIHKPKNLKTSSGGDGIKI